MASQATSERRGSSNSAICPLHTVFASFLICPQSLNVAGYGYRQMRGVVPAGLPSVLIWLSMERIAEQALLPNARAKTSLKFRRKHPGPSLLQPAATSPGSLTPTEAPLIDTSILFSQAGPAHAIRWSPRTTRCRHCDYVEGQQHGYVYHPTLRYHPYSSTKELTEVGYGFPDSQRNYFEKCGPASFSPSIR